jgi:aminopeptidase YwaD
LNEETKFNQDFAYQVMTAICRIGSRVVGSTGESQAAELIKTYFKNYGVNEASISKYPIIYYDGLEAKISTVDRSQILTGVPCWMSASTPPTGVVAPTNYLGDYRAVSKLSEDTVRGKIVFVLMLQQYSPDVIEAWDKLFNMQPAGVVFLDLERDEAPRAYNFQKLDAIFSKISSMTVSAKQSQPMHDLMFGSHLRLTVRGESREGHLHNVVARIEGQTEQTIVICAHHDTVPFTTGATDNAAGVAIVLELARLLSKEKLHYTYQFAIFGGEEREMKGSQKFLEIFGLEDVILCLNFDSIGALPGIVLALTAGPDELIDWVTGITDKNQYPAVCRRVATSGGDNIPFAACGVPTIHFACQGTTTEKVSHSSIDAPELLTPRALFEVGNLARRIIENLETSDLIPFKIEVPDDLKEAARKRIGSD